MSVLTQQLEEKPTSERELLNAIYEYRAYQARLFWIEFLIACSTSEANTP